MRDPSLVASEADIRQQAIKGGEVPSTDIETPAGRKCKRLICCCNPKGGWSCKNIESALVGRNGLAHPTQYAMGTVELSQGNQIVYAQGDPTNSVFYVHTGKVKVTVI